MSRTIDLQVSFADLEFMRQGIFLDPVLQTISDFLDQQEEMIEKVRHDLERGLKNPHTGRNGLTPPQGLRSLVLRRVKNCDYTPPTTPCGGTRCGSSRASSATSLRPWGVG